MRNIIRCRRGASAFAAIIALTPLIGVMALGAEAGSWYITRQHAQNAADAAAYAGAQYLACSLANGGTCPTDTTSVSYRGKEFAAANGFCDSGDSTNYPNQFNCATHTLPTNVSQTVTLSTLTSWNGNSGNFVQANVHQRQPPYLVAILGWTDFITIPAKAVAKVEKPKQICGLGLNPNQSSLWIGGNVALTGNGCGLQSDGTVKYSSTPSFPNGAANWAFYGTTGCVSTSNECSNPGTTYNYYSQFAYDPLSKLNSESFNNNPKLGSIGDPCKGGGTVNPNTPTTAYSGCQVTNGKTVTFTSGGTYFFYNAAITINNGIVSGTNINIVLLGNSSVSITGGTVNLSANANNTTYPDLNGVLFDDQAPNKSSNAVSITGGSNVTITLGGAMYFPNVDVTWNGNTQNANTACTEVVANTLKMTGNAYMSTSGCAAGTLVWNQVVELVQ